VSKRGLLLEKFNISIRLTAAAMKETSFGRFEQSFMFHMIRDFFLLLIVVAGLELGIRYAVVVYVLSEAMSLLLCVPSWLNYRAVFLQSPMPFKTHHPRQS
jgi:hypothetical protein